MTAFRDQRPGEIVLMTSKNLIPEAFERLRPELQPAEEQGFDTSRVLLMLDEVLSNSYRHGYKHAEGKPIGVRVRISGDRCQVVVRDQAPTFDCVEHAKNRSLPDPRSGKPGGMGLIIVHKICDQFVHQIPVEGGNALYLSLTLTRHQNAGDAGPKLTRRGA